MIVPDQPLLLLPSLLTDEISNLSSTPSTPYTTPPFVELLLFTYLTLYSDRDFEGFDDDEEEDEGEREGTLD
jgi:hypothetical protein